VTSESRDRFLATVRAALSALELRDPDAVAAALIAFSEGILLDQAHAGKPVLSARALRATLLAILRSSQRA
jgi:hypothetical protein